MLNKSDVDSILRNCATLKDCVPTLKKRGKNWYLDFAFEESEKGYLTDTCLNAQDQYIKMIEYYLK